MGERDFAAEYQEAAQEYASLRVTANAKRRAAELMAEEYDCATKVANEKHCALTQIHRDWLNSVIAGASQ